MKSRQRLLIARMVQRVELSGWKGQERNEHVLSVGALPPWEKREHGQKGG